MTRPPASPAHPSRAIQLDRGLCFDPRAWQHDDERELPPAMRDWLAHVRAGRIGGHRKG